jgi:transposase
MSDAMLDARQEDGSYCRIEVITGQRRRRRWTAEEKARIVAESFAEGARQHFRGGATPWRCPWASRWATQVRGGSQRRDAKLRAGPDRSRGGSRDSGRAGPPSAAVHTRLPETAWPPGKLRGAIEIEVRGRASGSRFALSPNWVPT